MQQAIVNLSFRQYIDHTCEGSFEQSVLFASYHEFLLRSQAYNPGMKCKTFSEMVANDVRANSLHYKCSFPVSPYIDTLKNRIPVLSDNGGNPIKFINRQFHIVESDISDITRHKVAITYMTDIMTLIDNIGDYLVLAYGNKAESILSWQTEVIDTFLLKVVPGLSVCNYSAVTMTLQKCS